MTPILSCLPGIPHPPALWPAVTQEVQTRSRMSSSGRRMWNPWSADDGGPLCLLVLVMGPLPPLPVGPGRLLGVGLQSSPHRLPLPSLLWRLRGTAASFLPPHHQPVPLLHPPTQGMVLSISIVLHITNADFCPDDAVLTVPFPLS